MVTFDDDRWRMRKLAHRHAPFAAAVRKERAFQDDAWGGPPHDDAHGWPEWGLILLRLLGELGDDLEQMRRIDALREEGRGLGAPGTVSMLEALRGRAVCLGATCAALVERLDRLAAELGFPRSWPE